MTQPTTREIKIRRRLRDDFEYYAPRCLKIATKPDDHGKSDILDFELNAAQRYVHKRAEEQKAQKGWVRILVLKGRQQGISTYVEGRGYHRTSQFRAQKTFILTHSQPATNNLFAMVDRYHKNAPPFVRPHVDRKNAQELKFSALDSSYQVATAGSKGAGRSATLTFVHGSEVGFWENGDAHLAGMLQAVPLAKGTEVWLESTANGIGNIFYKQWKMAERGESDFLAVFVPWFWQEEYQRQDLPDGFELNGDAESVPDGELTEIEYSELHKLDNYRMYWRRRKIVELGGGEEGFFLFKQEYPATADEAFQASNLNSFLSRRSVLKARKSTVATPGRLIIGVDPAGDGQDGDSTAIIRRRTRRLFDPQRFRGLNTMQIAALVHRIIIKEKPHKVFIDVGGLGKGVYDRLTEMDGTAGIIVPVNFGERAFDPDNFVNHKAEMAWELKEWLDDPGGANIPDTDDIQGDFLTSVADDPDSNQRRRLKPKKWLKAQGFASPDLFDASCLTFAMPVSGSITTAVGSANAEFDPLDGSVYEGHEIGSSFHDFEV